MKKSILMLLAVAALTSCSKFEPVPGEKSGSPVKLYGDIYTGAETRGQGIIGTAVPSGGLVFSVYRADQTGTLGAFTYSGVSFEPLYITGTLAAAPGSIVPSAPLWYLPETTQESQFIGLYPVNTTGYSTTTKKVTYPASVIDGSTDLMSSIPAGGSGATFSTPLNLEFHHLLTKIEVAIKAPTATAAAVSNLYGNITEIKIDDRKSDVEVTLPTAGSTTDYGSAVATGTVNDLDLWNADGTAATSKIIPTDGNEETYGYAMFVPVTSGKIKLLISTQKVGGKECITTNNETLLAGYGYKITVLFDGTSVSVESVTSTGSLYNWIDTNVTNPLPGNPI
jgi:hypothetical protein